MTNSNTHPTLTPEAFAVLGGGQVAYVREIKSEEVKSLFPQAPQIAPGMKLFSLHAGTVRRSSSPTAAKRRLRTRASTNSTPSACTNRKRARLNQAALLAAGAVSNVWIASRSRAVRSLRAASGSRSKRAMRASAFR